MIDIDLLLAWGGAFKKVSMNENIFKQGQPCFFYHQLVSGKVKWTHIDDAGKDRIHLMVEPGESFGEFPLFDDGPYAATAIAEEDSVVIRLHKPTFLELLHDNIDLNYSLLKLLSKRLRFKFSVINSYALHSPETMIATLINHLKTENKSFCSNCFQLKLTRQQIADMTGLRVETVIRTMRLMHEKGELEISKGKVYCRNMIERIEA